MIQWLRLCIATTGGVGLIPDWRSSACYGVWAQKKVWFKLKKKQQLKTKDHKNLYKQLYANEMDNLEEMYKFLER